MSASADKVELILEQLLQDSLPLVNKGIFTQQQMRYMMKLREKHENSMLKSTYKLTDYLKAIQFQYELERKRRHIIASSEQVNPLFKKQSKTDFVIIKRIIKIWDRTMHKFRYRIDLWKQYLNFCLKIQSKKHFYKALSNALKFIPFNQELWKIGIQYEIQIGNNMWKARKIFIKAVRMNPTNIFLWMQFVQFEIDFIQKISQRQKIIKGEQDGMKIIAHQIDSESQKQSQEQLNNNMPQIDIANYDNIIWVVIQEAIAKCKHQNMRKLIQNKLVQKLPEVNKQVKDIIEKLLKKIIEKPHSIVQQQQQKKSQINNTHQYIKKPTNKEEEFDYFISMINSYKDGSIDWKVCEQAVKSFLLKPHQLANILQQLLMIHFQISYQMLINKFSMLNMSAQVLNVVLKAVLNLDEQTTINENFCKFIDKSIKKLDIESYKSIQLLKNVIKYNHNQNNYKQNNIIFRSISINFKNRPQIPQMCKNFINSQN